MYSFLFRIACVMCMAAALCSCSPDHGSKTETTDKSRQLSAGIDTATVLAMHQDSAPPVWNGDYVKKYKDGTIMMKGEYRNGKRWGQWMSFFPNGKLWSEGYYEDGKRDGRAIVYYENGNKYYDGYYTGGRMTGKWKLYSEDGRLLKEQDYGK